jgi:hypothetical protein
LVRRLVFSSFTVCAPSSIVHSPHSRHHHDNNALAACERRYPKPSSAPPRRSLRAPIPRPAVMAANGCCALPHIEGIEGGLDCQRVRIKAIATSLRILPDHPFRQGAHENRRSTWRAGVLTFGTRPGSGRGSTKREWSQRPRTSQDSHQRGPESDHAGLSSATHRDRCRKPSCCATPGIAP